MNEKVALDLMAGMDEATVTALANFGGGYLKFLWWKDVILPWVGGSSFFILAMVTIYFIFKRHDKDEGEK
ncbi:hypothetical protein H8E88_02505 [candidate division KSB1 bacterium]|nr:hypothetical protein [candidate division KSB1 bacterium]